MKSLCLLLLVLCHTVAMRAGDVVYTFDFTTQPNGKALPWLLSHGFEHKLELTNLNPRFEDGALWLSTPGQEAGLLGYTFPAAGALAGVKRARITWGVAQFPEGADWERGNNRTPLAVMISFGYERLPSGLPFGINPAPYFIAPFFGTHEPEGKVYTGRLWKRGGRYVCVRSAKPGATVVTEIDLDRTFHAQFGKVPTPPVSAIGIQMNTKDTKGGASAFIRKIEFLSE